VCLVSLFWRHTHSGYDETALTVFTVADTVSDFHRIPRQRILQRYKKYYYYRIIEINDCFQYIIEVFVYFFIKHFVIKKNFTNVVVQNLI